jgi:hypothetical protein
MEHCYEFLVFLRRNILFAEYYSDRSENRGELASLCEKVRNSKAKLEWEAHRLAAFR